MKPATFARPALSLLVGCAAALAARAEVPVELTRHSELDTFYVEVGIGGRSADYLVDTGAGYMTITTETRDHLRDRGLATYVGELEGELADGSVLRVPLYRLQEIRIGEACRLQNVEAAVLPGADRGLFGLSALSKAAPFMFSMDPPRLEVSNCDAYAPEDARQLADAAAGE